MHMSTARGNAAADIRDRGFRSWGDCRREIFTATQARSLLDTQQPRADGRRWVRVPSHCEFNILSRATQGLAGSQDRRRFAPIPTRTTASQRSTTTNRFPYTTALQLAVPPSWTSSRR